jgi:hypothetical protein
VALSAPVLALPLVGSLPDHPPEALQLAAFVDDQLSVADPPLLTVVGPAVRERIGTITAAGDTARPVEVFPEAVWLPPDVVQSVSAAISTQHNARRKMPRG